MPSKHRLSLGIAVAALSGLIAVGVAVADVTSISDGTKTHGPLDITSASAGHASSTKLLHSFTTTDRIPNSRRASFCLRVYFGKPSKSTINQIDRIICATGRDDEAHITGTGTAGSTQHSFGFVRILKSNNGRTLRFRQKNLVGDRNHYWWALDTFYRAQHGQCTHGCNDSAPNGSKTVIHRL
jgi:hypothetical protein